MCLPLLHTAPLGSARLIVIVAVADEQDTTDDITAHINSFSLSLSLSLCLCLLIALSTRHQLHYATRWFSLLLMD